MSVHSRPQRVPNAPYRARRNGPSPASCPSPHSRLVEPAAPSLQPISNTLGISHARMRVAGATDSESAPHALPHPTYVHTLRLAIHPLNHLYVLDQWSNDAQLTGHRRQYRLPASAQHAGAKSQIVRRASSASATWSTLTRAAANGRRNGSKSIPPYTAKSFCRVLALRWPWSS
jgi:hypothetical protein